MAKVIPVARPLNFEDGPVAWGAALGVTPEDAENVKVALHHLVKSTNPLEQNKEFARIIKDLRGAAQNTSAFLVCLGEAEFCGLDFENLNEAIRVFRWIDTQCAAAIQALPETRDRRRGRRAGRVPKDLKYWNRMIAVASDLFGHYRMHWSCGSLRTKTLSSDVLITSFELAYTINGVIPPCHLLQVVQAASEVGITPDLIKQLVLAHHPMRVGDFIALMRDGLLTSANYWELASRPQLVAALSYEGLRHLLTAWKQHPEEELLGFARGLANELYPQGIPTGENPVWAGTPTNLLSFLAAVKGLLEKRGGTDFNYLDHNEGPGRYVPQDARILLSPEITIVSPTVDPLEEDEDVVLEMPDGDQDEGVVSLTLEISVLDEDGPMEEPVQPAVSDNGLDDAVYSLWAETFEARVQAQHDRLALLDDLSEEPPIPVESPVPEVETTPWSDVHALIAMDAREGREGIQDSNLLALFVDIGEVEHLLNLAARGNTDGVLELWSAWMDPVRDRIRELDARLRDLASRPATVTEVVVMQAPAPVVESVPEPEPEPEPEPAPTAPPPAPAAPELPPLPDGELGELFREVYTSLARLPSGTIKRQITRQLEDLRTEAIAGGNPRSIRPRTEALRGDIQEFLNINN